MEKENNKRKSNALFVFLRDSFIVISTLVVFMIFCEKTGVPPIIEVSIGLPATVLGGIWVFSLPWRWKE